jgi:hypothetical protein
LQTGQLQNTWPFRCPVFGSGVAKPMPQVNLSAPGTGDSAFGGLLMRGRVRISAHKSTDQRQYTTDDDMHATSPEHSATASSTALVTMKRKNAFKA